MVLTGFVPVTGFNQGSRNPEGDSRGSRRCHVDGEEVVPSPDRPGERRGLKVGVPVTALGVLYPSYCYLL